MKLEVLLKLTHLKEQKAREFFESFAKEEAELKRYQQQLMEAIVNPEMKIRVQRLFESCEEAMTKAFGKNEQF